MRTLGMPAPTGAQSEKKKALGELQSGSDPSTEQLRKEPHAELSVARQLAQELREHHVGHGHWGVFFVRGQRGFYKFIKVFLRTKILDLS
jgi:hypothetical protein